ncbi:hypothetical protein LTR17_020657 [Elasticomyces elasticus]|nr:hypothetical protein LTR17_020657 [Elasticomyces elasticus]
MADEEQPFRLLDLPPELRVRIYECLYQDESVGDLDYLTLREHVPSVAITLTNRLIRHEAMPLYERATKSFYQQHIFYVKMRMPDGGTGPDGEPGDTNLPEDMRDILNIAAAMPQLPISSVRIKLCLEDRGSDREYQDLRVDVKVTSGGGVEATHFWESAPGRRDVPYSGEWLCDGAEGTQTVMIQQNDARYLEGGNILRVVVMVFGWLPEE